MSNMELEKERIHYCFGLNIAKNIFEGYVLIPDISQNLKAKKVSK